jgi:hypothetical protein
MTPKQYKAAIAQLGLSQERAGLFFGESPRQGQRWALGERPIPVGVIIAVTMMLEHGKMPADFNKLLGRTGDDRF